MGSEYAEALVSDYTMKKVESDGMKTVGMALVISSADGLLLEILTLISLLSYSLSACIFYTNMIHYYHKLVKIKFYKEISTYLL